MADFALGFSDPPDNIEELATPLPVPRASIPNYAERVTAASGRVYGRGYLTCQWTFSRLTAAQRAQLKSFCAGESANVYISTLADDDTYKTYHAVMRWAENETREPATRERLELIVTFSQMEIV